MIQYTSRGRTKLQVLKVVEQESEFGKFGIGRWNVKSKPTQDISEVVRALEDG
jgi:hypothetical protein